MPGNLLRFPVPSRPLIPTLERKPASNLPLVRTARTPRSSPIFSNGVPLPLPPRSPA